MTPSGDEQRFKLDISFVCPHVSSLTANNLYNLCNCQRRLGVNVLVDSREERSRLDHRAR